MAKPDRPRELALMVLTKVEDGAFSDDLLDEVRQSLEDRDRSFVLELVNGTLRNRAHLDWALNQFSAQPIAKTDTWTRNILRLAGYQMLFLDRVPVSAAVNTSTELAKHHGHKKGYVNGLLRNLDRGRSSITMPDEHLKRLAVLYSHPEWLIRRWVKRFGAGATERILEQNNRPAPLIIRANALKTTKTLLTQALINEGVTVSETLYAPEGLQITTIPGGLTALTAYREGLFMVQDQAAQLISLMLSPRPGDLVLDACAAPGGKATYLAELMNDHGRVVALDKDRHRLQKIVENSKRLGISCISPECGDAAVYRSEPFDSVLIDAPCSGLGVLRRHPDGRWNKHEIAINERQSLQKRILNNCSSLLKKGGVLVYATCTTEKEENEEVISSFLAEKAGEFTVDDPRSFLPEQASVLVDESGYFHSYPEALEMDGFFGVRITRSR